MNKTQIDNLFANIDQLRVVVVGDVMLDNYWWGEVERISPEAPVPVVALHHRESRLGGAANVALNCRALGAKVAIASVVGDDNEGATLTKIAREKGLDTSLLLCSKKRPTTTKVRVISRNQQMMRLDDEITDDLFPEEENVFIDAVVKHLQTEKPDVVIFEDYNKGVLKDSVIKRIIAQCNRLGIITTVDPKRKNFLTFKNVTVFKPNLKEVREGLHLYLDDVQEKELGMVHGKLNEALGHSVTFITLSEKGVYYNDGGSSAIIPSHIRNIADVSGAGDTVIATASVIYALTKDARLMAEISNIAGGLVCEEVGVAPIKKDILLKECERLLCSE